MQKLIIDTDCGVDDSIAILMALAAPAVEVIGITCVSGNVGLDHVARNVPIVLDAIGVAQVPLFRGAARPLLAAPHYAGEVHGEDGLGDVGFPTSARAFEHEHAALAIVRLAREHPGATLVALGPLTNVALALAIEPELPRLLGRSVIMGGAFRALGNVTAAAEFNIYADAEAAAIVLERGLNPVLIGWELTVETAMPWARWDAMTANAGTIGAAFVAPVVAETVRRGRERERPGILLPDPLAMAVALDPGCAEGFAATVAVDTGWGPGRGLTAVDRRVGSGQPQNAEVITAVDLGRFAALLEQAFGLECRLGG